MRRDRCHEDIADQLGRGLGGSWSAPSSGGGARKTPKVVRRIGVDEKAVAKGHRYLTLVCDLEEGTVEHIAEERKQESLEGYYRRVYPRSS